MLRLTKRKPASERAAEGETEGVYHEIKQTLRVSGVNLNFRTWAGYGRFLPLMWDVLRPNRETRAFEDAADKIRAEAAAAASGFPPAGATGVLGESQSWQSRAALDLYHYINPKLLIVTSAVKFSLDGHAFPEDAPADAAHVERGVPARVYPMEMAEEDAGEEIEKVFAVIKKTLRLESVNSDYRNPGAVAGLFGRSLARLEAHRRPSGVRESGGPPARIVARTGRADAAARSTHPQGGR